MEDDGLKPGAESGGRTGERKRMEKKFSAGEERILSGNVIRAVLHEIRNHLGTINTTAYYVKSKLKKGVPATEEANLVRFLEIIEQEIKRCTAVAERISDFIRPFSVTPEPVDVEEIVEAAREQLVGKQLFPGNVELIKNFKPGLPPAAADRKLLLWVLAELMTNALEAMPAGGTLTIATAEWHPAPSGAGAGVEIAVADTGKGIPEPNLEKLFDPAFTTKIQGYGFGLPLAAAVIAGHNGELKVESGENRGTVVKIRLPVAPAAG